MTPEERQMLTDLANKLAQTPSAQPDPEAGEFIRAHIGARPDALYLMTQTVLIQNLALEHAKQQIDELQKRAQPATPPPSSSFLGAGTPGTWTTPQATTNYPGPAAPPPPPAQPAAPPSSGFFGGGGGGSSFLKSAATTAAGIAAGALAFEGIRSLFGMGEHTGFGFGGGPHVGSFLGGGGVGMPGGETVINNYYDSPGNESRDAGAVNTEDVVQEDATDQDDTTDQDDGTAQDDTTADADEDTSYDDSADESSDDGGDYSGGGGDDMV